FAILFVFIKKTKIGKAMTAVSQDREVAMLMGVNTKRLYMLTMGLSAMLA
ncbi:MAG: branched-chain amino acid ABC transporter permease, partial [Nitrososphaeria archaeon]|nr:branched-chain amino acid ABC transporter permease [Nitrososphaeria archaeon]